MFTGVIKLAQIDDYISPSQNCIQPKIMKKDKNQEKATVSLNDCLACSGCITSAESILVQQMSLNKLLSILSKQQTCSCKEESTQTFKETIFLIMSPQALLSLAKKYRLSPDCFMNSFQGFLKKNFKSHFKIFDLHNATKICHQLIFQEFIKHLHSSANTPIICSECPGWVCYAQKTLTKQITQLMSKVKSPQQILGRLIKKIYGKDSYIVSVAPCYDKKLEAIRFDIEQNLKEVDLTLSTIEIVELINKFTKLESSQDFFEYISETQYRFEPILPQLKQQEKIKFIEDQTSNGYVNVILKKLGISQYNKKQIRNADFQEYSFILEGQQIKIAKCYGFRNIQKIVQAVKKGKCQYKYIEMMACPGGCFSGGGQVRYEQTKNKEIVQQFIKTIDTFPKQCEDLENELQNLIEDIREEVMAEYKPIQKTLEQSVMNW